MIGIDTFVKPKYHPALFPLIVQQIPRELDGEFVTNKIQQTIVSSEWIKPIRYAYQRRISDYRFDVKHYQEYNFLETSVIDSTI